MSNRLPIIGVFAAIILFLIYSSVFVAAAIAMWLGVKREDLVKAGPAKDQDPNDPNAGAVV